MASGPGERARLLARTRELILQRGVLGLSLSELARSIGSNNRMLLYHFGSLDELIDAAVDEVIGGTELLDRLAELLGSPGTPMDRLVAAWRHLADPARRPHLRLFFARFGMAVERPEHDAELLIQIRDRWTAVVADALRGEVESPDDLAVAVVALWRGLQLQLVCGEDSARLDAVHTDAVTGLLYGSIRK